MNILFTKHNGEHVETTGKDVLFEAAKNGEISPDTIVTIDGMGIEAARIKGLVFGTPSTAPELPKPTQVPEPPKPSKKEEKTLPPSIRSAFDGLIFFGVCVWILAAGIFFLVAVLLFGKENISGGLAFLGAAISCILNARLAAWLLRILEYIAVNTTKKNDAR